MVFKDCSFAYSGFRFLKKLIDQFGANADSEIAPMVKKSVPVRKRVPQLRPSVGHNFAVILRELGLGMPIFRREAFIVFAQTFVFPLYMGEMFVSNPVFLNGLLKKPAK